MIYFNSEIGFKYNHFFGNCFHNFFLTVISKDIIKKHIMSKYIVAVGQRLMNTSADSSVDSCASAERWKFSISALTQSTAENANYCV